MGRLEGRVAVVTGAGRGLGREHALLMAEEGARIVVNDLGGDEFGEGQDPTPAQEVAELIKSKGGEAVVSGHDVADWQQAEELIRLASDTFGDLHVLVNNAGIVRDRTIANISEQEWDAVIRVHLKGHAAPTHHACAYWRDQAKSKEQVKASVVHTSSASGLVGNFGQANYASAKLAVVALSRVVSMEGARYGIRSNVIAPAAATRMGQTVPSAEDDPTEILDEEGFDMLNPANISPLVAWLAQADCPSNSQVFQVYGSRIMILRVTQIEHSIKTSGRWTLDRLDAEIPPRLITSLELKDLAPDLAELFEK